MVDGRYLDKKLSDRRDGATVRVIKCFAKSLKVTQDHLK